MQDQLTFLIEELDWSLYPRRQGCKPPAPYLRHGYLEASKDPRQIREWLQRDPRAAWGRRTSAAQPAVDIEMREIQGKDGILSLRRHAELLGLKQGLIPYGETPIDISPGPGIHIHYTGSGDRLPSRLLLPHVELKADNGSINLPPEPGRDWDPASPPTLIPMPLPEWISVLALGESDGRAKQSPSLPPEGPLGEQEATALGDHIAGRIVAKALSRATSLADARNAARGLGWLASCDRISNIYAQRALDHLAEELPSFGESGFSRSRLRKTLFTTYERRRRRG